MINILKDDHGILRNGWWILTFYVVLGALVVPATLYASSVHAPVSPAAQAGLAAIATAICLLARRERPASVVGGAESWKVGVPAGLALGFIIWGVAAAVLWASGAVHWQWIGTTLPSLSAAVLGCLAVAAVEELVFRGFAFQRLVAGIGAWAAQVVMGAYFVLTHSAGIAAAGEVKWLAAANIFAASLLFGMAYLRTRSLAMPIALHFALNFVQGTLLGFGVSGTETTGLLQPELAQGASWWTGGGFGLEASIPGTAAVVAALILLGRWYIPQQSARADLVAP